jgi:hypothetical protein
MTGDCDARIIAASPRTLFSIRTGSGFGMAEAKP